MQDNGTYMKKDYLFMGSKELGLRTFEAAHSSSPEKKWLVICPEDEQDQRSKKDEFITLCEKLSVEVKFVKNKLETSELIRSSGAKAALVCGWYWLLSPQDLSSLHQGFWGIHNSLLPKYRGGSPLVWSMINGEKVVGSSLFKLTPEMDEGELLGQVKTEVTEEDDIQTVTKRLSELMVEQIRVKWAEIDSGVFELVAQNNEEATYCGQRIPEDGAINWALNAATVHNFIRAQTSPYPGAFSYIDSTKIFILSSELTSLKYSGTPGQILSATKSYILVACGEHSAIKINKSGIVFCDPKDATINFGITSRFISP